MARILVLGAKVPFTHGGQEVLVATLVKHLRARGHEADVVELPFNPLPKQNLIAQAAMWRALDLSEFAGQPIDLVIATKFPTYYARHPKKSVWLVHQLRSMYDLYGGQYSDIGDDPRDEALRRMITDGDTTVLAECSYRAAISKNVADRLEAFNGLSSHVLYPPLPQGNAYQSAGAKPYILSVGRICRIKRLDLMLEALPFVDPTLSLKVVGVSDEPGAMEYFTNVMNKNNLAGRVQFLGRVGNEELVDLYSKATGVFYAPFDEDYGYVTLEAMASGRPVVTATDSGGTLEFVRDGESGRVVAPEPQAVAEAFNGLVRDPEGAKRMGAAGRSFIEASGMLDTGWDAVIDGLLSPLLSPDIAGRNKVIGV
jgi:glycosyltransferase involved in cell wall biosynthesis